jgi:predicted molibdopterin-dependent oxidoreductase YjgC
MISTFLDKPMADSMCSQCAECVTVCPVGALTLKNRKGVDETLSSDA